MDEYDKPLLGHLGKPEVADFQRVVFDVVGHWAAGGLHQFVGDGLQIGLGVFKPSAHGLHVMATRKVCAKAQAAGAMAIMEQLTEDELYIFKRGRNSHMGTVPKHAEMSDYRAASGLEALLGYLFLSGEDGRIRELMDNIKQSLFTEDKEK